MIRRRKAALAVLVALGGVGLFGLGRATAGQPGTAGQHSGAVPHSTSGQPGGGQSYLDGLVAGRAQGVQEGRALQEGAALPADARDAATAAFNAGYAAGANDVFGGWDGGWSTGVPYLVILVPGSDGVTYRIASREQLRSGVTYFLCPDQVTLCRGPGR